MQHCPAAMCIYDRQDSITSIVLAMQNPISEAVSVISISPLNSIYWEEYYKRRDYPNLLPACPRIIDPANPANNLYRTGISSYRPNEKACDYEPGDGNWTVLKRNIGTLDLTRTVAEIGQ